MDEIGPAGRVVHSQQAAGHTIDGLDVVVPIHHDHAHGQGTEHGGDRRGGAGWHGLRGRSRRTGGRLRGRLPVPAARRQGPRQADSARSRRRRLAPVDLELWGDRSEEIRQRGGRFGRA